MRSAIGEPPGSRVVTTLTAARAQPLGQGADLGGLSGPLDPLEGDEAPACDHGCSRGGVWRGR